MSFICIASLTISEVFKPRIPLLLCAAPRTVSKGCCCPHRISFSSATYRFMAGSYVRSESSILQDILYDFDEVQALSSCHISLHS